ncbi:uncharacterized protein C7orf57 homolog, partial [Odontesthes bonariensis]|uniref:uncharacterized protein C7orf57 homolog n=1 Tax=Odontesthes bonariensis TaxID=219752 RepID=UPI003F58C6BA
RDPPGVKTGYLALDGHISQIPGLSPTIGKPPQERTRGRRAAVLDSDSDYVKLAKQGGHKGLLWYEETFTSTPTPYKPPNWFGTESGDARKSSLINSEEKKNPGAFQPREPPFGTDSMSAWERDDDNCDEKEKSIDDHNSQMVDFQTSSKHYTTSKFKRTTFDKKPAPVDMSKLLRGGYAEDGKPVQ